MIRVYYLPIYTINNTEVVAGIEHIHHAILDRTQDPTTAKLIQDTTQEEHNVLSSVSISWQEATQDEIDHFNTTVIITEPDPDTIRAQEILATSAAIITMPEIWELLRIIGRRLGYRLD